MAALSKPASERSARLILMLGVPLLAGAVLVVLYALGGRYVATDDAYIQVARQTVSSDIAGRVVEVAVHDNQSVKAGQLLLRIDDRPLQIALEEALAQLESAKLKLAAEKALYAERQAEFRQAVDHLDYQKRDLDRKKRLREFGIATDADYELAQQAYTESREKIAAAQQQIEEVRASLGGDSSRAVEDHPSVKEAQAAVDRARLNLSYTRVTAVEDGIATKVEQLQAGDYVAIGQPLFTMISASRAWVEANFKETDIAHMRPGQKATLNIDGYPEHALTAHVQSLSPGTGSAFSLLPPENATGNWVKVVQRLPVRLSFDDVPKEIALQAGMSVDVEVDTGYRRPLAKTLGLAKSENGK
jgi:membrane fusion protein (multidrug efflux system)